MVTSKQLVLNAIARRDVDHVPVAPPFQGYWALGVSGVSVRDSIQNPSLAVKAQLDQVARCGFDAFEASWDWLSPVEVLGCKVSVPVKGEIVTKTRIISGPESLSRIEPVDPRKDRRAVSAAKTAEALVREMGDEKFLYSTLCCPFTLVGELRGVEALLLDIVMQPDFAREMLDRATDMIMAYSEYYSSTGVDGILLCDPTASGSLVNTKEFEEYSRPYITKCLKKVRDADRCPMVHICGDTSMLLEDISDVGADVFSLDHLVNLRVASSKLNKKMAILGNLRPFDSLYSKGIPEIIEESKACIQKTGGKGFILGAGCDFVVDTPLQNVAAMRTASIELAKRA
jgi:MtaA/CmuA family methyltransferase